MIKQASRWVGTLADTRCPRHPLQATFRTSHWPPDCFRVRTTKKSVYFTFVPWFDPVASALQIVSPSGWAPLRRPLFRNRWIALLVSNLGSWMQDTAGTWLMTALTTSPLLIALMQTAASLPVLFLGLPAGATADIFDRRRLLIF